MAKYAEDEFAQWAAGAFDWDQQPELVKLPVANEPLDLFGAQRPLDEERAVGIGGHFLPAVAAGVVVAFLPDGRRVFVDGQHRWRAAQIAGVSHIWALVYHYSEEQASAMFRLKNGRAVLVSTHLDTTRAGNEATYPPALGIYQVLGTFGLDLSWDRRSRDNKVAASQIAERIYDVDEGRLLNDALQFLQDAYATEAGMPGEVLTGDMLTATAQFLAHVEGQLTSADLRSLQARLRRRGLDDVLAKARELWREHKSARFAVYLEQQLVKAHNYDRKDERRLPERSVREMQHEHPQLREMAAAGRKARAKRITHE